MFWEIIKKYEADWGWRNLKFYAKCNPMQEARIGFRLQCTFKESNPMNYLYSMNLYRHCIPLRNLGDPVELLSLHTYDSSLTEFFYYLKSLRFSGNF